MPIFLTRTWEKGSDKINFNIFSMQFVHSMSKSKLNRAWLLMPLQNDNISNNIIFTWKRLSNTLVNPDEDRQVLSRFSFWDCFSIFFYKKKKILHKPHVFWVFMFFSSYFYSAYRSFKASWTKMTPLYKVEVKSPTYSMTSFYSPVWFEQK